LEKEVIFADDLEVIFGKRQIPYNLPEPENKETENSEHTD